MDDEKWGLTPWGCMYAVLKEYGYDTERLTPKMGEHMVEDFMAMMVNARYYIDKFEREEINGYIKRQDAIDTFLTDGSIFVYGEDTCKAIVSRIKQLPSAEPKIIHCGDCKYKDDGIDEDGIPFLKCLNGRSYGGTRINDYCSWAERRTDEQAN